MNAPLTRSLVPAFFIVDAPREQADGVAATAAQFLNDCTTDQEAGAPVKLYLCEASGTTALHGADAENPPRSLHGYTCDTDGRDLLIAAVRMAVLTLEHPQRVKLDRDEDNIRTLRNVLAGVGGDKGMALLSTPDPARALLAQFDARFGEAVAEDADINGGDAVEWISDFAPRVRAVLAGTAHVAPAESTQEAVSAGESALIDCIVSMRADIGPLVTAAQLSVEWTNGSWYVLCPADANDARAAFSNRAHASEDDALAEAADALAEALVPFTSQPAQVADTVTIADEAIPTVTRPDAVMVSMPVTDELCAAILCTALEGGIGYWSVADKITRGGGSNDHVTAEDYLSYVLEPDDEGEGDFPPTLVDFAAVRRGIQLILTPGAGLRRDLIDAVRAGVAENDGGHIDADAADAIVQFACFGNLVYG